MSKTNGPLSSEIRFGAIVRPHGLRGAVVIGADPTLAGSIRPGARFSAHRDGDDNAHVLTVATVSRHKSGLLVRFVDVDTRQAAEAAVGLELRVPRSALPALAEGEYYDRDVIGCVVVDAEGSELGHVAQVIATAANDIFVVRGVNGEILVPVIDGVVGTIDPDQGRVLVTNTDGLVHSQPGRPSATKD